MMEPKEKRLLQETARLTEENHKLLKKINRSLKWGRIFRILYWVIILGTTFGAYYFIQPYIEQFINVYSGIRGGVSGVQSGGSDLSTFSGFQEAFQRFSGLLP
jgi:Trk-type K+ transport system membrane component